MDGYNKKAEIILLLDRYNTEARDLHMSFLAAGHGYPAVVIEDDGFLPENVLSVYGSLLGDFKGAGNSLGRPRYFNEITVPDYWEISGTNSNGKVHDLHQERGRIYYAEPLHKRQVRVVDWCDDRGKVRASDHYNRYGALYARTVFNKKEQKVNKSYFSADGKEVIVENFVTGDIILNDGNEIRIFRTKTDFVRYFLERAGFLNSRIFFNSLSTPFFVSQRLNDNGKGDVLFWQEPIKDEIPGNMQIILRRQATRTEKIFVQKRQSYDRLLALGANADIVEKKGYIYSFERENRHGREALICTNSDQIEQCREIVSALPQMHFHIAALTEMSSKLMDMGTYENVTLYPCVKTAVLDDLFGRCDWYLDINHGGEIVSAARRAFLNNQLIYAFQNTLHNGDLVAESHIYAPENAGQMVSDIKSAMGNSGRMEANLAAQREAAMSETEEAYAIRL